MLVLAILSTIGALAWTVLVVFANGMSDAPGAGFQGGLSLWLAWAAVAVIWVAYVSSFFVKG